MSFLDSLFGRKVEVATEEVAPESDVVVANPDALPIHVTDDTFDELVLSSPLPALVDFWAPWCGPCRMIAPIVEDLAKTYDGQAVIAKMNTDDEAETPGQFRIMAIPTMILFKDGEEVERMVGLRQKNAIAEALDKLLQE